MFEVFEHTADLGLRVRAPSLQDLFADAARGLFSVLVANLDQVRPLQETVVHVEAPGVSDREYLLFDWLNELLYLFDTQQLLLCDFNVAFDSGGLQAVCRGETVDTGRHQLEHEVKAITYHGLRCEQSSDGWLAEVILDI